MSIRPRKIRKPPEYRNDVEKNQLAIRAVVARRNQRLNASQKALRAAERAGEGKPIPDQPIPTDSAADATPGTESPKSPGTTRVDGSDVPGG